MPDRSSRSNEQDSHVKRVYLHVGAPKTGTTYLQNVLFQNRERLAAAGVLYPYERRDESFRSMQDFRRQGWAGARASAFAGDWERVATRVRSWDGHTAIISNELFSGSSQRRITSGVPRLGTAEIHVVYSARDLARQLVSDWQEHIKHKHTVTLEEFVDDLIEFGFDASPPFGELFWGMHDPAYVLKRWESVAPPQNIHVVTLPPPGAPRDTLWRRFCAVTGLDPTAYDVETTRVNRSMGLAETELVRRMNFQVRSMPPPQYDVLVRRLLAGRILGGGAHRLRLPSGRIDWVARRSRQLVEELTTAGYQIAGDLDDLVPRESDHVGYVSPTELSDADLAPAAIRAATGLLTHSARQRRRIIELKHQASGTTPPSPTLRDKAGDLLQQVHASASGLLRRRRSERRRSEKGRRA